MRCKTMNWVEKGPGRSFLGQTHHDTWSPMRVSELGYGNKLSLFSGSECGSWNGLGQATSIPPVRHTNYHSLNILVCSVPEKGTHFADKGTLFAENNTISGSRNGYFFGPRNGNLLLCFNRKDPKMGTEYVPISGTRKLWFWMSSVREIYDSKQTHKPCQQGLLLPSPYELQHRPMPWGAPRVLKSPPHVSLPKQSLNTHL